MLADFLRQSFTAIGLLAVVISRDWKLALISLSLLPFVLLPTARLGRRIRRTTRRAQDHAAELSQILQESLSGHQVVKAFGAEQYESGRFRAASRRLRAANLRYVAQQAAASPLIEFFGALTIVGLLWYARTQIAAGAMDVKGFTSFVTALLMLYEPVKRLTGIHNIFQQALGASQKVFEYLDRREDIRDKPEARRLTGFRNGILFDDVTFHYPASPNGFLLDGIRLEVRAGEIVALVGPSGAGKTTLASLVPRFYDVTRGAVRVDGADVRDLQLASLRATIGVVPQDPFLFNDTVANNIRYGRPEAGEEAVREAARNAMS
jgi:subfamily B ATP-binding cassette protein MsbA